MLETWKEVATTALTGTASGMLMRPNSKWAISLTGMSCRLSLLDADELVHQVQAIELCDRAVDTGPGFVHPAPRVVELDGEANLGERECDFLGMRCRECREQVLERLVILAVEHARVLDTSAITGGQAGGDRLLQQCLAVRVARVVDVELKAWLFPTAFACAAKRRVPTAILSECRYGCMYVSSMCIYV